MSESAESGHPSQVEFNITSDSDRLAEVRDKAKNLSLAIGFGPEDAQRILLAIDEALANVIKHAYEGVPQKPIDIKMAPVSQEGREGILVEICDEGKQVDPSQIRGRDLEDIRPGGLGVYLMKTVMDRVVYSKRSCGMKLEMVKFLADQEEQDQARTDSA